MVGLVESIKLVGVLIFAIPAALAGLEFLLVRGEPLVGTLLLAFAIGLVLVQRLFTLPTGPAGVLATLVRGPTVGESAEHPPASDESEE